MQSLVTASNETVFRFDDDLSSFTPNRLKIVWIENTLDCRTWTYYCDLKEAMSKLHELCVPRGGTARRASGSLMAPRLFLVDR